MTAIVSLEQLLTLIPPPLQPVEIPTPQKWQEVESRLGPLPQDYREFITRYGSGVIDGFLWIFNPASVNFHGNFEAQIQVQLGSLQEIYKNEPEIEAELFPGPGGLLPIGGTAHSDTLFWKTTGTPENWTVVILDAGLGRVDLPLNLTGSLAALLTRKAETGRFFPEDFPSNRPSFVLPKFSDFSSEFGGGRFLLSSVNFSKNLHWCLQSQPWSWLTWYWMPPHPDWSTIAGAAFFDLSRLDDSRAVKTFLSESGFAACAAVAVLYSAETPSLLLPPDLLLPYLAKIFEGYGGSYFLFGCTDLKPDPEIVPGVIAQFDFTPRFRFVRQHAASA